MDELNNSKSENYENQKNYIKSIKKISAIPIKNIGKRQNKKIRTTITQKRMMRTMRKNKK
jgi:hypothetical protein